MSRRIAALLALALFTAACATGTVEKQRNEPADPMPSLNAAPESQRVDIEKPSFSNSTRVTNPLFPISELKSALLLGNVDGVPLRVEVTLMPETKKIPWDGKTTENLVSQYVAYLGGRIKEVALDWYAQADDGAVWYFGEDVFNFADGVVADREGTWIAGKDGTAAMIMPGLPKVGNVFRPENIPGVVFEEVTVQKVDFDVNGPRGIVKGAILTSELHMDGSLESKVFAPGYGEFSTGAGGDLEEVAIVIGIDSIGGDPPAELTDILTSTRAVHGAAISGDWTTAESSSSKAASSFAVLSKKAMPPLLRTQMEFALSRMKGDFLHPAVDGRNSGGAARASLDVELAGWDLMLQYRPIKQVDLGRLAILAKRAVLDADANEPANVQGDAAAADWTFDRIQADVSSGERSKINGLIKDLGEAAADEDMKAARAAAVKLVEALDLLRLA